MKIKYSNIIYQILTTMPLSSDDSASPWIEGDPSIVGVTADGSLEGQQAPAADETTQQRRGLVHGLTREMRVQLGLEPPESRKK